VLLAGFLPFQVKAAIVVQINESTFTPLTVSIIHKPPEMSSKIFIKSYRGQNLMTATPFELSLCLSFLSQPSINFIHEKSPLSAKMVSWKVAFFDMSIDCDF
jgi:hypothetical protein